ncbi:TetR/AcrR family transcriptional regulator [Catellatospora bangladeshensis]|uniref:TetR family transcriptional regulator n=1 Tax=Catellatospora bangladeshensis TaxID=310355 RepID=A0A8J3JIF5_9ACTN|nr:TetR/AcrR family transcriptional regulator [Catellatospora bangladeshensis]GIF79560.1 TetR family transcriptional regulator [Catellatospora bangladeshensis]
MTDTARAYHHGDLRRAILDAALEVLAEDGPGALSLRELARRAGVSHAAPAHHFRDKAGLLTAVAVDGYRLLAEALAEAPDMRERGVAYVRFALAYPAHFGVMFRPDLYHADAPELIAAREESGRLLHGGLAAMPATRTGDDPVAAATAAWSLAHGFATLWQSGGLRNLAGDTDPLTAFRAAATLLFPARP